MRPKQIISQLLKVTFFRYEVDINAVGWSNVAKFPFLLNEDYKRTLLSGWWNALTPCASFDTFMDNYFTFFCQLTNLGVNNI